MEEILANSFSSCADVVYPSDAELLDMEQFRRSPNRGSGATRPKRNYTTPQGEVYFKFGLIDNEICAELFAYAIGTQLGLPMAVTRLAKSDIVFGVASYDNGGYSEMSDEYGYSVKDFIGIPGFIDMCLFDYLIMNEDRHAGNWGTKNGRVAPLFDHNLSFGGDVVIRDLPTFMARVTSPFYVEGQYEQNHNDLLKYFVEFHLEAVSAFMCKASEVKLVQNNLWSEHYCRECEHLNKVLAGRIKYMIGKVGEYSARQDSDNEFPK